MQATHLGDGLYASFDGWQIELKAQRENGWHVVYLEPGTYHEFLRYAKQCFQPATSVVDQKID